MMSLNDVLIAICLAAIVTYITRLIPFILFGDKKRIPKIILYIEKFIPGMIMVILVMNSLKTISISNIPQSLALIISSICVALLHFYQKNALVSIFTGTILYMFLVQTNILNFINF